MSPASFSRVLACTAILLAAPCAGVETAPAGAPPAAEQGPLAGIEALIAAGRFEDALSRLRRLDEDEAAGGEARFFLGLAAIGAAQRPGLAVAARDALLDEAIAALRAMLIDDPGRVRVRLELARAFFHKGDDGLARRHFEQVLAGKPPPNVAANIARFLAEIRARKRWDYYLGASIVPDSNIGGASDERHIDIWFLSFPRDDDQLARSGIGAALWGGAEREYPLGPALRLRTGASGARWEYAGSRFDRMSASVHLGPRWLIDRRTDVSLLATARQHWTGKAPSHRGLEIRAEIGYRASRRATALAQISWERRRYWLRPELDGPAGGASLRGYWAVAPTIRANLAGGFSVERPEAPRWRNTGQWAGVGATVDLPLGFTVGGGGDIRWTRFGGNWWPNRRDGSPRHDVTVVLRGSVHNRGFTVFGFSPELALTRERRDSNAQLHSYRRTRGELRFVRQF